MRAVRQGHWWLIGSMLFCGVLGCRSTRPTKSPVFESERSSTNTRLIHPDSGFFIVEPERSLVNPDELLILRAHIATVALGAQKVGRLQAMSDDRADFIRWQACPKFGDKGCIEGESALSEVFWGVLAPGPYTVVVRACVRADRTSNGQEGCGPLYFIEWHHPAVVDDQHSELLDQLRAQEQELRLLGVQTHAVLREFRDDLAQCQRIASETRRTFVDRADARRFEEMVMVQLQNLINLGPDYLSYQTASDLSPEIDTSLIETLSEDQSPTTDPLAPTYVPRGFSLTSNDLTQQVHQSLLGSRVLLGSTPQPIANLPVAKALQGSTPQSTGLSLSGESTSDLVVGWEGMTSWQQATAVASMALFGFGGLLTQEAATEFAGYRLFAAVLNIKRDDYPCGAFNKAVESFAPIKEAIRARQQRVRELQRQLQEQAFMSQDLLQ